MLAPRTLLKQAAVAGDTEQTKSEEKEKPKSNADFRKLFQLHEGYARSSDVDYYTV